MVTGASGLLGTRIVEQASRSGHEVYGTYKDHQHEHGKPVRVDLTEEQQVRKLVRETRPDTIINAAAVTDVDFCESNPDAAFLVNATSVDYLADAAKESNSFLVQVSTHYVFSGERGRYLESDIPNPINKYGSSKLKGEEAAMRMGEGNWAVGRASVVYGWGRHYRPNAATYVYDKLSKGERVSMIIDQFSSPTLNTNLAQMLLDMAVRKITGMVHTAGASRLNRYDFAVHIAQKFGLDTRLISSTDSTKLSWKAKRPRDSSLATSKASRVLSTAPLSIDQALEVLARERTSLVSQHNV